MKKRLLSLLLAATTILAGCGSSDTTSTTTGTSGAGGESQVVTTNSDVKLGMVSPVFGTQSYNDDILNGIVTACSEFGLDHIAMETPEVSDVPDALRTLISQGVNFLVITSSDYVDAMNQVADEYPDVKFLYTQDVLPEWHDSTLTVGFKDEEGAFLAGALAGLVTESNNVGAVLAMTDDNQFRYQFAYMAGAKYTNENVEVQTAFTNSYADVTKGQEIANIMYEKGADIVATYAGACNLGVFNAATDAGKYAIGAANGQFENAPDRIIASVVKPIDGLIVSIVGEFLDGEFNTAEPRMLGLAEGGVELRFSTESAMDGVVADDIKAQIEEITNDINNGTIAVPKTEAEYNSFVG